MSRRATPRRPCTWQSKRGWEHPRPPWRTGRQARTRCNAPVTHLVKLPWGFMTYGDGFDEPRHDRWGRYKLSPACEEHARSIERYQRSIGQKVGVYRFRRV